MPLELVDSMRRIVTSKAASKFSMPESEAETIVKHSAFEKMLKHDPIYAGHYDAEVWADDVYAEYLGIEPV